MTMLCTLIRGQMSYTFFQLGAHVLLCQLLGGQMSSYAIFHRGAHVRGGGGNVLHSFLVEHCPKVWNSVILLCIFQCRFLSYAVFINIKSQNITTTLFYSTLL